MNPPAAPPLISPEHTRSLRVERGDFRPRGVRWQPFQVEGTGSTNRLWRGSGPSGEWLLKWYRYPSPGIHPEPEVAQFLSKKHYPGAAAFGARIDALRAEIWQTVGFIQRWVEGESVWKKAVSLMQDSGDGGGFAKELGQSVGRFHKVMASGETGTPFGTEPWDGAARQRLRLRLTQGLATLDRAFLEAPPQALAPDLWQTARSTWGRVRAGAGARAQDVSSLSVEGRMSRIHGDLHLGQILETSSSREECRFVLIDMEGEPTRPAEERRARDLPLRDVAGMWRSFSYAAAVAGAPPSVAEFWCERFLEGWCGQLPPPAGDWRSLLEALVWEKAVYEAEYEIQHRPGWLWIPMQALSKLER